MDKIEEVLTRGVEEVIVKDSLIKKLRSGRKLVIKLGIDPTGSELHLGHAVVLTKLRAFQDLGHQAVFVIGDFTAKIGDPSGRTEERKKLTDSVIRQNMISYKEQAAKILDIDKIKVVYNSSWFSKMAIEGLLELASKATIAQIFERKEFRERFKQNIDIPYLEMLYPLMQGYDSVQLKADVELGGSDQKFNLLMGRQIQNRYGQREQDLVIMKLLPGTDGAKMSKSAGNFISLTANSYDMYGKIMSVSDELLSLYYELCTNTSTSEISQIEEKTQKGGPDVFRLKKDLAETIVTHYHGVKDAHDAEKNFEKVHEKGNYEESRLVSQTIEPGKYSRIQIPIISGATTSTVRSKDLFQQGAIELNGQTLRELKGDIALRQGDMLKIGKWRIVKVR